MTTDLFTLVMRDDAGLDSALLDDQRLPGTLRGLLFWSVLGLFVHGLAVGVVAQLATGGALASSLSAWLGLWPVLALPLGLTGAFVGALMICLPSFYFYTQIAGLDAPFRVVTAQALRVKARTSVLLLGCLPFYVALALASVAGLVDDVTMVIAVGLGLPFAIGLAGIESLRKSFARLASVLPITHPRRVRFLNVLSLAWGAVFTAVTPVALYRLVEWLGGFGAMI